MCVDAETGDLRWGLDLERDWGTTIPFWYTGQCPLIDGDVAVIAPAGCALMMGVDCATGEIMWQTPNPRGLRMSHTSIVEMLVDGVRMYVYSAVGGIVGVAAEGPRRGEILWESTAWTHNVLAPTPVMLPGGRLFVTAGYGAGSGVLEVKPEGDGYRVDPVQRYGPGEGLASEQQTPVLWGGRLLAIQPKDAGELRNQLVAVAPDDATRVLWASGPEHRFGLGPYLVADDRLFLLDDDGTLTMVELSDRGFRPLAEARILDGVDAWGPLALAGGRLLLRDLTRLVCLDLRAGREGGG
jgi:outer membrane protein assembly factor BamB